MVKMEDWKKRVGFRSEEWRNFLKIAKTRLRFFYIREPIRARIGSVRSRIRQGSDQFQQKDRRTLGCILLELDPSSDLEKCRNEASFLLYPRTDPRTDGFMKASDPEGLGSVSTETQARPRMYLVIYRSEAGSIDPRSDLSGQTLIRARISVSLQQLQKLQFSKPFSPFSANSNSHIGQTFYQF